MSHQFYSNQLCHKEKEEDEPIDTIANEPSEDNDKVSAETSNEDLEEAQLQRVNQELVQYQPAKSEIESSSGHNEDSNAKSTPRPNWNITKPANSTNYLRKDSEQKIDDDSENDTYSDNVEQSSPTKILPDGNSADPLNPTKSSQVEPSLNWADEVDEETPLTHYEPVVFLTSPPVKEGST